MTRGPGLPTHEPGALDAHVTALLLEHADRSFHGDASDGAVWAAVASVERIACRIGSTNAAELRAVLTDHRLPLASRATLQLVAEAHDSVVRGLGYRARGMVVDAGVLNPEGGVYPVATEADVVRAGVRAAYRTCTQVEYYTLRYADSAGRYSGADSAWLALQGTQPLGEAQRQVDWLTRLLASRGMPSWLMERHLTDLVTELDTACGDGSLGSASGSLPGVRDELARRRRAVLPDVLLDEAEGWLRDQLGAEPAPAPLAGTLLAAAVADVGSGLLTHDRVLLDWLIDPVRCSELARVAVEATREALLRVCRVEVAAPTRRRGRR
ncbi:hypothetical protein [Nocardioides sp. GY 10127]|uniref:hypothetical protein n=1 Tax=Nocardioides sp. GY 10127 TaxID=2569762 RepID=UPI0010A7CD64|nr:hypothetical protein [Nocardioides sp. GY 10127]TIC86513.1 hypothetical protein E8D37_01035 [Nocardioides sp. GY 10127]